MNDLEFFAPCPRGLERVLAAELGAMGIKRVRALKSGVGFFGSLEQGYRACLWSRTASRILLVLARVDAADADEIYEGVRSLDWRTHIRHDGSLAVDAKGVNNGLRNTQFTAVRVKDAVCDYLREKTGVRPDVNPHNPDVRLNVTLHEKRATISVDLAGEPLHRRGYRSDGKQVAAPLKEALAAGMLLLADWPAIVRKGGVFIDPLCGSGTLAIEAAMIAGDIAPGIMRSNWGFTRWLGHDAPAWDRLLEEADARAQTGRSAIPPLYASDNDAFSIELAEANARRAMLGDAITFKVADIADLAVPEGTPGLIATNPPYGVRLATQAQLPALYASFASRLKAGFDGYKLAIISPDEGIDAGLGMRADEVHTLYNGKIESPLHIYYLGGKSNVREDIAAAFERAASTREGVRHCSPLGAATILIGDQKVYVSHENSGQFAARLSKMYAVRRKWARKNKVDCYRVYDADLPDYAVAVDFYKGAGPDEGKCWVHVAEYAPPKEIDPAKAARRLADIMAIVPVVFGINADRVFLKVRHRGRGGSQYGHQKSGQVVSGIVSEDFLEFEVNLSEYLDTGLFLDMRTVREMIFEKADRVRFLNLFAYTGTASVHAAAGGAFTTTTVDLSQTYLSWAKRNMEQNGFRGDSHEYVRADCLRWVSEQRHGKNRWDLIFCDPPTFSNSSKMGGTDWEVQRDHVEFLIDVSRLLTREGMAIFACNLRNFKPDTEALAKADVSIEDITGQTIPADFERTPKVHHCYIVKRAGR